MALKLPPAAGWATPSITFAPASLGVGRYVSGGAKWGGALGTGVALSYSFPGAHINSASHAADYGEGEWDQGWYALNSVEQAAVRAGLATWARFANLTFQEANDTSVTVGEMRFAFSYELGDDAAAHAWLPAQSPEAGDVWFNPDNFNADGGGVPVGSYDFLTILHEVGHALGLKHTFESPNVTPAAQDNCFYSIMSYTASPWSAHGDNYASFYPTTPMYYDLVAIEAMYGRRSNYNTGNTIYTFNDGVRYWQTINDSSGLDRMVYVGAENVTINLNPGAFSTLSEAISFSNSHGGTVTSKATVSIGPGVVIEMAIGGNGNDALIGNNVRNFLIGGSGNDSLRGYHGNDVLTGGPGSDAFIFNTAPNSSTNRDEVQDYNTLQDTIYLENAIFTRLAPAAHLNAANFWAGPAAHDSNDYIIYNRSAGLLMYDSNANLAGGVVQVAVFARQPPLTASEFAVI